MLNFLFNGANKFKNNFDSYPDAIVVINKFGDIVYNNKLFHSVFALNDSYEPVNNINDLIENFILPLNDVNATFPMTGIVKYTLNNDFAYLEYSVSKEEKTSDPEFFNNGTFMELYSHSHIPIGGRSRTGGDR